MALEDLHATFPPSSLGDIARCPGKRNLERQMVEIELEDPGATFGTAGHEFLASWLQAMRDVPNVDAAIQDATKSVKDHKMRFLLDRCLRWLVRGPRGRVVATWDGYPEVRLELRDREKQYLTHGTADLVLAPPPLEPTRRPVVVDWKFYHEPLDELSARLQITAYGVGACQRWRAKAARGLLYLPVLDIEYTADIGLDEGLEEIEAVIAAARDPDAPRRIGPQCRRCAAATICPEARAAAETMLEQLPAEGSSKAAIRERCEGQLKELVANGAIRRVAELGELAEIVAPLCDAVRSAIRALLEAGHAAELPAWELVNKEVRARANVLAIYERVAPVLSDEEFADSCSVTWKNLERHYLDRVLREAAERGHKFPKKSARELLDAFLGSAVQKTTRTELRRKKGKAPRTPKALDEGGKF